MRTSHVCPKCKHNRILLIDSVPDTGEYATEIRELHIATVASGFRAGKLGAAVCKACGYTELYTEDPDRIEVDGRLVREVVGPQPGAPYR